MNDKKEKLSTDTVEAVQLIGIKEHPIFCKYPKWLNTILTFADSLTVDENEKKLHIVKLPNEYTMNIGDYIAVNPKGKIMVYNEKTVNTIKELYPNILSIGKDSGIKKNSMEKYRLNEMDEDSTVGNEVEYEKSTIESLKNEISILKDYIVYLKKDIESLKKTENIINSL